MAHIKKINIGNEVYNIVPSIDNAYFAISDDKLTLNEEYKSIINSINGDINIIFVTYNELKELKDNSKLIPSQKYRITDYNCILRKSNLYSNTPQQLKDAEYQQDYLYAKSANHPFDIIVEALTPNTLSEDAKACLHEGDEYFKNCNLESWELKYSFDNDTKRFAWANETNGKGVIYYMKDEDDNICPYDFKNILQAFYGGDNALFNNNASKNPNEHPYYYTFTCTNQDGEMYDLSVGKYEKKYNGKILYKSCVNNVIEGSTHVLPAIIFNNPYLSDVNWDFCNHNKIHSSSHFIKIDTLSYSIDMGKSCMRVYIGGDSVSGSLFHGGCENVIFENGLSASEIGWAVENFHFKSRMGGMKIDNNNVPSSKVIIGNGNSTLYKVHIKPLYKANNTTTSALTSSNKYVTTLTTDKNGDIKIETP